MSDSVSQTTIDTDSASHFSGLSNKSSVQASKRFEQMLEYKRANEDRLQDNFEQLLSRSSPTENTKTVSEEVRNPLTSVIAPNLLFMVTDIVIPCEISDEEETLSSVKETRLSDESSPVAECDLKTPII